MFFVIKHDKHVSLTMTLQGFLANMLTLYFREKGRLQPQTRQTLHINELVYLTGQFVLVCSQQVLKSKSEKFKRSSDSNGFQCTS